MGFPGGTTGKEFACQFRRHKRLKFDPWVRKIPWRRAWQPTPVFLPAESGGKRSLVGYSPWGHKELDTTEETDTQEADMPSSLSILKRDLIPNSKASSLGTHFLLGIAHVYMNQMLQTSVFLFINLSFLKATRLKNQKGRWKNIFFFPKLNFCISFSTSTVQFPKAFSNINKCRLYLTSSPSHYQDKAHCSSRGRPIK